MKFKYCKNNCLETIDDDSGLYNYYKCDCNEYKLTIRKNLFAINKFRIAAVIINNYKVIDNLSNLFIFKIIYTNVIEISLDGDFIFDLNYMLDDQYILDKVISYWENLIFK